MISNHFSPILLIKVKRLAYQITGAVSWQVTKILQDKMGLEIEFFTELF